MSNLSGKICSFNSEVVNDTTIIKTSFIIHDFDVSYNGQQISKEVCQENLSTLIHKPIVCKYYNSGDSEVDHLGTHEVIIIQNRDTQDYEISTDTVPVGVITKAYITNYQGIDVLMGEGVLWLDRFYNVCSLLNEWYEKGIRVATSCEYMFGNYRMINGVQHIESPYSYVGLCLLNSEEKDGYGVVNPAYDSSHMVSFNEAIKHDLKNRQDIESNNDRGEENMEEKKEEIDTIDNLETTPTEGETPTLEEQGQEVGDGEVSELEPTEGEEKPQEEPIENSNTEKETKDDKIQELTKELEIAQNTIGELKLGIAEDKIEYSQKVSALNSKIEELLPYKELVKKQEFETALNEKVEYYKEKFTVLNSVEKFETEEVQNLIKETLEDEKSINAKLSLAEILEGCILAKTDQPKEEKEQFKEFCNKKIENLTSYVSTEKDYGFVTN